MDGDYPKANHAARLTPQLLCVWRWTEQHAVQSVRQHLALPRYGDAMKQRIILTIEIVGGIIACLGVGMLHTSAGLIAAGTLIVVACEANS
jgi:hypothetical protein